MRASRVGLSWQGAGFIIVLGLLVISVPQSLAQEDFACKSCLFEPNSTTPKTIRAMYLASPGVVENPAAVAKAKEMGLTDMDCNNPLKAIPECFVGTNWNEGWVAELADRILQSLGVNIIGMTKANFSAASAALYTGVSSFTRCVYEVKVGHVDLCVGDFWEMPARRRVAPFTSPMSLDKMFLVTRIVGKEEFGPKDLMSWAKPFTPEVWGTTVAAFFVFGVMLWIVEAPAGFEDFDDEHRLGTPLGLCLTTWMSFMAFCTAAPMHGFSTWPGRIMGFGFAFMIFILVASYTASLAMMLITSSTLSTFVVDLADARANGHKVCMLEPLETVLDLDPKLKRLIDDYGPVLDQTKRGLCGAGVIGAKEYRYFMLEQDRTFTVCQDPEDERQLSTCKDPEKEAVTIELNCKCTDPATPPEECPDQCPHHKGLCDLTKVENLESLSIPFAMPVAKELQDPISAWIVELKFGGEGDYVQTLMTKHGASIDETKALPNVCNNEGDEGGSEEDPLDIKAMAGTFVVAGGFLVLGTVVHVLQLLFCKASSAEEEDELPGKDAGGGSEVALAIMQLQRSVAQISAKIDALAESKDESSTSAPLNSAPLRHDMGRKRSAPAVTAETGHVSVRFQAEEFDARSDASSVRDSTGRRASVTGSAPGKAQGSDPVNEFMNHDIVKALTFRQG